MSIAGTRMPSMRKSLLASILLLVTTAVLAASENAPVQGTVGDVKPAAAVVLTKLFPPIYPPLARQASISGDVTVKLRIGKYGSVESVEVVSGHAMLKQAALESARKSRFECRECGDAVVYLLTYSFVVKKFNPDYCKLPVKAPEVSVAQNHVTITAEPLCVQDERSVATGEPERLCGE